MVRSRPVNHNEVEWSDHAKKRWRERFSGNDWIHEWSKSQIASKKARRIIADSCQYHKEMSEGRAFKGAYYRIGPNKIVFVCVPGPTIVTVFPLSIK